MKTKLLLSFLTISVFICASFNANAQQSGDNDPTFNPTDIGFGFGDGANNIINTTAIQSDGKIIIGGQFTSYDGTARNRIARLNADGTLDGTFTVGTGANNIVGTTAIQSDGKIIIGGNFTSYNGIAINRIARLNTDGTLDTTFADTAYKAVTGANNYVYTTAIQNDGKIIIGGDFTFYNGAWRNRIARLNIDGTLDSTFIVGAGATFSVYTTAIQNDGKIIIGGSFTSYNGTLINRIARLNADGTIDGTFLVGSGVNSYYVNTISIQPDGKIIIGGWFTSYNGTGSKNIARLNADGTLDGTFLIGTGANFSVYTTAIQNDGKIIIGGEFTSYNGTAVNRINRIARLYADGTLDSTFIQGMGANNYVYTTTIQSDGEIIIGGSFTAYSGTTRNYIVRLKINGTLSGANDGVSTTAIQSDGKIIIGGNFTSYNGIPINRIARLNADGTLDGAFNIGSGVNGNVNTASIQSDGKIIIGGWFTSYNGASTRGIARLNPDGTLDGTFNIGTGADKYVYTTTIQPDGKIIIGGTFATYNGASTRGIARLNADGTLDGTFNVGLGISGGISTTAIQPDGKIIIGGGFFSYNGTSINCIARLNTDGSLDGTFNVGTGADIGVWATAVQGDGKIIIGGGFSNYNGTSTGGFARLNADGSLDGTFNIGTGPDNYVFRTAIQSDGKIIIGGKFTSFNGTSINRIARLNTDGTLDGTFDVGTGVDSYYVTSISVQPDGKIIITGHFSTYNGICRTRMARILGFCSASPITANATASTVCAGTSVTLTGAGATSYVWSGGVTDGVGFIPTSTTMYTVIGKDGNGCINTATITITVNNVSVGLTMVKDTVNPLLWYVYPAITGTAPFTYLWDFGDGNTSTQQYPTHTYSVAAHYAICLTVTDANGCSAFTCDSTYKMMSTDSIKYLIVVDPLTTGVKSLTNETDISIYPNPTNGLIHISYPTNATDIFVTDIVGRKVFVTANRNEKTIDLSFAPSGIYFLYVKTANGVTIKKIAKQ